MSRSVPFVIFLMFMSAACSGSSDNAGSTGGNSGTGGAAIGGNVSSGGSAGSIGTAVGGTSAGGHSGTSVSSPAWMPQCLADRQAQCGNCAYANCLLCIYGTAQEKQNGAATCTALPTQYQQYCTCSVASCPTCNY